MQSNEFVAGWEKFLNPKKLKSNLISASLFLAAYESLRASIVDQVRGFYWTGFDEHGDNFSDSYTTRVLSRHKSPLRASLLWFLEMQAVTQDDLDLVDRLREHRNKIAHDLPAFVASADCDVDLDLLKQLIELVAKVDRWWIREIELSCDPDFDDRDLSQMDDAEIASGRMIFLSMLFDIATGDESISMDRYEAFMKVLATSNSDSANAGAEYMV